VNNRGLPQKYSELASELCIIFGGLFYVKNFNRELRPYCLWREVKKVAKDVLCEVNSCKYWANGNNCNASSIYVVNRRGQQAANSEETDCKTFEPKI
jgi:hypothetical protein